MAEHKISDEVMLNGIIAAHEAIKPIIELINKMVAEIGKPKFTYEHDTEGVEPLISLFPVENVFREDKVVNGDMRDELVDLAPRKKDGQYLVPKTVE